MNKNFLIAFALATAFSAAQAMENQKKPIPSNSVSTTAEASAHKATGITPADKNLDEARLVNELYDAVWCRNLQKCQQLLAAKADPNKEHVITPISGINSTCLEKAVCDGSTDICRVLISAKAQINLKRSNPYINLATYWGHIDTARLLLASGANATDKNDNGLTAICARASVDDSYFCALLIEYGADDTGIKPTTLINYIQKIIAERTQYHLANARTLRANLFSEISPFIIVSALAHIVIDYAIPANLADVIYDNKFQAALRHKELYEASEAPAQKSSSTSPADNETKKD